MSAEAILIGCVAQKADGPRAAQYLYRGTLWEKRRAYAKAESAELHIPWAILTAKHPGIILPNQMTWPYDRKIQDLNKSDLRTWRSHFGHQLYCLLCRSYWDEKYTQSIPSTNGFHIEVHAGRAYVDALNPVLEKREIEITTPLKGMGIGEQLAWYNEQLGVPGGQKRLFGAAS